jgi:hypothetical protein
VRPWLLPLALWLMSCAWAGPSAQIPSAPLVRNPTPTWVLMPQAGDALARKYRETQLDSLSLEYMACLRYVATDVQPGGRFYLLVSARFPSDQEAWIQRDNDGRIVNYRVRGSCDSDELHLHTHSGVHCEVLRPGRCATPAGWMHPSGIDSVAVQDNPLAFVQYGPTTLFGYWPDSLPAWALPPPIRKKP